MADGHEDTKVVVEMSGERNLSPREARFLAIERERLRKDTMPVVPPKDKRRFLLTGGDLSVGAKVVAMRALIPFSGVLLPGQTRFSISTDAERPVKLTFQLTIPMGGAMGLESQRQEYDYELENGITELPQAVPVVAGTEVTMVVTACEKFFYSLLLEEH